MQTFFPGLQPPIGNMCTPDSHHTHTRSGHKAQTFSCSKLKLDNLFLQWFSLPESQQLVLELLEDVKAGRLVTSHSGPVSKKHAGGSVQVSTFPSSTPPLSPKKGPFSSPFSPSAKPPASPLNKPTVPGASIPPFYMPPSTIDLEEGRRSARSQLEVFFTNGNDVIGAEQLKALLRQVFGLPTSLAYPLMARLSSHARKNSGSPPVQEAGVFALVHREHLLNFLDSTKFWVISAAERTFHILRTHPTEYITPLDFQPLLSGVLSSHPGLEFLAESPEFQTRYSETVVYRIFYALNRNGDGRLTLRELKKGDLVAVLHEIDDQDDINKVLRYFSYEHFYVIYCKFWDLDTDHDFLLSREDVLRYGSHSMTFKITDRLFSEVARPFSSKIPGKMNYEDFVWFILSEEDKTTDTALEYWFRCIDLDGDGKLSGDELMFFYEEQLHRMECLSQESVSFLDIMSQMLDMLEPEEKTCFTLRDLKRTRPLSGTLFNVLFNLNKFMAFETRDPFVMRQEREDAGLTDWEKFARAEYVRLAVEDGDDVESLEDEDPRWGP